MVMVIDPPARTTVQECRDWAIQLKSDWTSGSHDFVKGIEDEEKLYFQEFSVTAPEGTPAVKTGSAPADADASTDSLTPYDVQVYVRPARAKQKFKRQADLLTRFAHAMLHSWREPVDIFAIVAFDMTVRRVGIVRVLYDDSVWTAPRPERDDDDDDDDEHKERVAAWEIANRWQNPIICERRDPRMVRWRRDHRQRLLAVTETYSITVTEARRAFGHEYTTAVNSIVSGRRGLDTVEVQDIWVGTDRCILIDDQPIFADSGVEPHGYPEIPYVIMPFRELGFDTPGERYRGMLSNAGGLYAAESQMLTMHMAQVAWNAWRTWTGFLGEEEEEIVVKPGDFIKVDKRRGHYIEMLEGEAVPPEIAQTVGMLDAYIQRNSVAGGPRGASEGTRSAQQVWAIQAQRQLKLEPAKNALRSGVQQMLRLATMIVENFMDEPLTLPVPGRDKDGEPNGEVTIKPTDILSYYSGYEVNFGRRLDPGLIEQAKALQIFATNNWMPLHTSWRLSGLTDNPQEWEDELLRQNIDRLPWIIELAAIKMAKKYFGAESPEYMRLIERMEQQEQGGAGSEPQGGAPGMPSPGGLEPPSARPRNAEEPGGMMGQGGAMGHKTPQGRPVGIKPPPGLSGGTPPGQSRGSPGF